MSKPETQKRLTSINNSYKIYNTLEKIYIQSLLASAQIYHGNWLYYEQNLEYELCASFCYLCSLITLQAMLLFKLSCTTCFWNDMVMLERN